jgi:MFS family permease
VRRPWIVLSFLTGVNLLNYIDRQILYAVFPPIQAELGLSDTQLGVLASAFMWVYLSTAPVFGLLADRWSRPRLMGAGLAIWSGATALTGLVRSHSELLLGRGGRHKVTRDAWACPELVRVIVSHDGVDRRQVLQT